MVRQKNRSLCFLHKLIANMRIIELDEIVDILTCKIQTPQKLQQHRDGIDALFRLCTMRRNTLHRDFQALADSFAANLAVQPGSIFSSRKA